jgi:8-oxo-dGTP pyrophosphatase MutT (NUDIX family)
MRPTRDDLQRLCSSFDRIAMDEVVPSLKHAAVALTVVERSGEPAFLLTRRTSRLSAHGGQFALPGGRCDEGETAIEAALRELDEEMGLRCEAHDVLGLLDDYPTRSGYLITPVVVWGGHDPVLTPNPKEVARVHYVKLADIAPSEVVEFFTIPESDRTLIRIHMAGNQVHAPTAALVFQFRELVAGRTTRVADLEQPVFAWR